MNAANNFIIKNNETQAGASLFEIANPEDFIHDGANIKTKQRKKESK